MTDLLEIGVHDMIQPLTSIKGQVDLLAHRLRKGDVPQEDLLQVLTTISERTSMLADRLRVALDAHRNGRSAFVVHVSRSDLAAIIHGVIKQLGPAERERLTLSGHERVLEGYWDGERIAQVLRDVIENAFKYSPAGSPVQIEVDANDEVKVTIRDRGVGLTREESQNIFQPSYRSPRVAGVAGTGLGLYASRVVVEAHGGRIWAESEGPGHGAAFHIVLPR